MVKPKGWSSFVISENKFPTLRTWIGFTLLLQGKKTSSMSWPRCWVPLQWTSCQAKFVPWKPHVDVNAVFRSFPPFHTWAKQKRESAFTQHMRQKHANMKKKNMLVSAYRFLPKPTSYRAYPMAAGLVAGADKTWIQAALQHCLRLTISKLHHGSL